MNFMKRAWRGEERLWRVFWFGAVLTNLFWAILTLILCLVLLFALKDKLGALNAVYIAGIVYLLMTLVFQIWVWVAQWRCAWNADSRIWGVLVRALVLFSLLGFGMQAYSFIGSSAEIVAMLAEDPTTPTAQVVSTPNVTAPPPAALAPATPAPATPVVHPNDMAGSMLCISQYQAAAKAPDATRASKVALCDCVVNNVGHVEPANANYEAEMTRCFAKLIGEPYALTSPTAAPDSAVPTAPAVSLPGSDSGGSVAVENTAPTLDSPAKTPTPVETPYSAEIAKIPPEKLPSLQKYCLLRAQEKAREKGSEEALFVSLNQGYIDFCILGRARGAGILPPEAPPAAEGK